MFIENYEVIKPFIVKTEYIDTVFAVGLKTNGQNWEFISNTDLNINVEYIRDKKIWLFIIPNEPDCETVLLNYIKTSLDYFFEMEKKDNIRVELINEIDILFNELDLEMFKKVKITPPTQHRIKQTNNNPETKQDNEI